MPDEKLTEEDKAEMQKALKDAALSDIEVRRLAEGEDEFGETSLPVDSGSDLVSAAASALEFVDGLDGAESKVDRVVGSTETGFDSLLKKLESMRGDIASLQRGVVGIFAAQLLTFRGKVVDLKSIISDEMVDKLRMPMFRGVIETTFVEIVDGEFAALEKELVDKIVDETQQRFKEFAKRVRESETDLRATILQQQDVVRSFMQSLEEEALASGDSLGGKEREIKALEDKIKGLYTQLDETKSVDVAREELNRRIADLESEVSELRDNLFRKDSVAEERTKERDDAKAEVDEIKIQLAESQTQLEVYKKAESTKKAPSASEKAEIKSLKSNVKLLEKSLAEKRKETERSAKAINDLERSLDTVKKEKAAAEKSSVSRLKELEGMQDNINDIKEMEQKIYDLDNVAKDAEKRVGIVEMQKEAFEKATRLMERERDIALEVRDIAEERAKRYIAVLGLQAKTKVLMLVDEVGKMSFSDLAKSLGIPTGLATKHARDLAKLGVLKIEDGIVISSLRDLELEEGEVKVD